MGKEEVLLNNDELDDLLKKYSGSSSSGSSSSSSSSSDSVSSNSVDDNSSVSSSYSNMSAGGSSSGGSVTSSDGSYRMSLKKPTRTSSRTFPSNRQESKPTQETKPETRPVPKSEPKLERNSVPNPEPKSKPKVEPESETIPKAKVENKSQSKASKDYDDYDWTASKYAPKSGVSASQEDIDSVIKKVMNKKPSTKEDELLRKKAKEREQKKQADEIKARKSQKNQIVNKIMNVFLVLCILVFVGSAGYLLRYYIKIRKAEKGFDNLKSMIVKESGASKKSGGTAGSSGGGNSSASDEEAIKILDIDGVHVQEKFEKLYRANNDFVGWITIPGTSVDYPVMQTKDDEEFYLHKDFNKEYSDSGTLFASSKSKLMTQSDNVLIYGHNMKAGTMFHTLLNFEDEDFYKKHHNIYFDTLEENGKYEVIAAFRTEITDDASSFKYYDFYQAESKEEFDEFVAKAKSLTPYTIDSTVEYGDRLLTLSTCAYHADEGRYVVIAMKVR